MSIINDFKSMNKKITYSLIVVFLVFIISLLTFYFLNQINTQKSKQKVDNIQPSVNTSDSSDVLKNNIITLCDTKECFLEKFKKCENIQYNYNKEKSLYFAVLDKVVDTKKCRTVLDLSMTKVLTCELNMSDLTEKNFNEILSASMKNISYLNSIGCKVLK